MKKKVPWLVLWMDDFGKTHKLGETYAVSEEKACNNVNFRICGNSQLIRDRMFAFPKIQSRHEPQRIFQIGAVCPSCETPDVQEHIGATCPNCEEFLLEPCRIPA